MEIVLLIAALGLILWVATGMIGFERVRQWLRLAEKPPYVVAHRYKQCPEGDPVIGASGAPSVAGTDAFFLTAEQVLNGQFGMFLWSFAAGSQPFAGGTLCLSGGIHRTPVQRSGGNTPPLDCSGSYSFHFSQAYMASQGLTAGTTLFGQYWSRDRGFLPPDNIGLTGGIRFTLCP